MDMNGEHSAFAALSKAETPPFSQIAETQFEEHHKTESRAAAGYSA